MCKGVVYFIKNIANNKEYIGCTNNKFKYRERDHLYYLEKNSHGNSNLQKDFNKFGKEYFKFGILEKGLSKNEIYEKERFYIKKRGAFKNGYNENTGGRKGFKCSQESIKKRQEKLSNLYDSSLRNAINNANNQSVNSIYKL